MFDIPSPPKAGWVFKDKAMKKLLLLSLAAGLLASCGAPQKEADEIQQLIAKMSLEEKVGEMTQLTIWPLLEADENGLKKPQRLDSAKLHHALVDLHVGSVLNVESYDYAVEEWAGVHKAIKAAEQHKPNKIPVLYGIDSNHGANYTKNATLFPQEIGQAASWDTTMAKEIGRITALETRISGIPWAFSPVLDVARDPRWPRFWETYGESTLLASWMGVAYTEGMQGTEENIDGEHVAVSLKHFLGYSASITGKDRTHAWIPERQLRQHYLPPFEAAVAAGAKSIMINSGDINGIPVHARKDILTDLLRGELGFEGIAVTDWSDIKYLFNRHRVAKDYKEAVAMAINAGVDMSMVPDDLDFPGLLVECVNEGLVPMSRIDESVYRILKVKKELGLFEETTAPDVALFNSDAHRATALKAAQNAVVLLKNEGVLPLDPSKVLVTGPTANSLIPLNGGWSHSWQGDNPELANSGIVPTIAEALQSRGASYLSSGESIAEVSSAGLPASLRGKTVVVAFGEWAYCEGVGDLEDMFLPQGQYDLIAELDRRGATIVGVMTAGRPRNIRDVEPLMDAILYAALPGDFGGEAIASILAGEANPSAKLPFTFPRHPSAHICFDHRPIDAMSIAAGPSGYEGTVAFGPQFEFGHGLSYTTFEISAALKNTEVEDVLEVELTITNTGDRAGRETVPVYYEDLVASIVPSVKNLCAYAQVDLEAGETKSVTLSIPRERFAFVGRDMEWITEPGDMKLKIAGEEYQFALR